MSTNLYDFCSAAGATSNPNSSLVEETAVGKTNLVNALKAAYDYCEATLASLNDVNGMTKVTAWREGTRLSFLVGEIEHTGLHYGNMVTYMRLKGVMPASTARRGW